MYRLLLDHLDLGRISGARFTFRQKISYRVYLMRPSEPLRAKCVTLLERFLKMAVPVLHPMEFRGKKTCEISHGDSVEFLVEYCMEFPWNCVKFPELSWKFHREFHMQSHRVSMENFTLSSGIP